MKRDVDDVGGLNKHKPYGRKTFIYSLQKFKHTKIC